MLRLGAAVAVLVVLVLAGCGDADEPEVLPTDIPTWNHDPEDATLGPTNWGDIDESFEQCLTGTGQSPVDIAGTVPAELPDIEFDYPATSLVVENTGHVIEVSPPEGSDQTLTIGDDEYRLVQFHFHAPSEHTLDGRSYDGEIHLVHESDEGELAVVAVFLERSADLALPLVDSLVAVAPEDAAEEVEVEGEHSPLELLYVLDATTAFGSSYYTYAGSLTTPGCTEGVRWIVTTEATGISPAATDRLHELIAGFPGYDGYENNNRPTQPLNDRAIESGEEP